MDAPKFFEKELIFNNIWSDVLART